VGRRRADKQGGPIGWDCVVAANPDPTDAASSNTDW
jgi:hypothetical protein